MPRAMSAIPAQRAKSMATPSGVAPNSSTHGTLGAMRKMAPTTISNHAAPTTTNLSSIIFLPSGELVRSVTSFADDQARFDILVRTASQLLSAFMRAFLLATSAGWRARLMLPTGVLSDVECPVTSK